MIPRQQPTIRRQVTARTAIAAALAAALFACPASGLAGWSELDVTGGATWVYQRELDTQERDTSISGDLRFDLPIDGGGWFLYIEGASGTDAGSIFNRYPEINADAGSVLDRDGGGHIQVSELHYRIDFGGHSQLTLGQVDPSAQIDRSPIANDENTQFLGASFKNNATIDFPDYTMGAIYRRKATDREPEFTLMLTSSEGIADNPSRSYRELIDVTGAGDGVFAAASARWRLGDDGDGSRQLGAGVWLRSDERDHLDDPTRQSMNYGAFVVYDASFGEQAINLRAGIANKDVSPANRFAAIAWQRAFAAGTLGAGYARILESSRARRATSGDTDHAELWFRLPLLAESLHGSLSLQYVSNPGFDRSNITAEAHALFAALRLDYAFGR